MIAAYFWSLLTLLQTIGGALWAAAVREPLHALYVHGFPWSGRSAPDVCSQLTNIDAQWWGDPGSPERLATCESLIRRRFDSFLVSTAVCCYFGVLCVVGGALLFRWCILRPFANEVVYFWRKMKTP